MASLLILLLLFNTIAGSPNQSRPRVSPPSSPFAEPTRERPTPDGFSRATLARLKLLEGQLIETIRPENCRREHRVFTEKPHMAGTVRNYELAQYIAKQWRDYGLEDVKLIEHPVYLPWPIKYEATLIGKREEKLSLKEEPIPQDKDSYSDDVGIPYCAYSADVDVTAPVVYVNSGNPEDYDLLAQQGVDVRGKIALARYSVPYSYRGFKALTAQRRGVAALILYSDPADDGFKKGEVYPWGPWGPESHLQRGGIVYDFNLPGDPRTPGWASVPGGRFLSAEDAVSMPTIAAAPMSYKDARKILEKMIGPHAPPEWQGGLPFKYRLGPSSDQLHLVIQNDKEVRSIWNIVGSIRGTKRPEDLVVLGNHRDAWVYGGVDPSSGSASLMETARAFGKLKRSGWKPLRTLIFASWDAEEFTLTGSTEWGELEAERLKNGALAYLNVDSSSSGNKFTAAAVPSLADFLRDVARDVPDPSGGSIYDSWLRNEDNKNAKDPTVSTRLGSGSDYTVFLNFLGIPIADLTFDGPYGVYHSIYDSFTWVDRIGDPGYYYHAAMARYWAVAALRLAECDYVPLDYAAYAREILIYLDESERAAKQREIELDLAPARAAARRWEDNARLALAAARLATKANNQTRAGRIHKALIRVERTLLDPAGLDGRPWFKHLIYAPRPTYKPLVLPALTQAIEAGNKSRAVAEVERLTRALNRATAVLHLGR
ncbi:MAG TPA: M28 family metallopeptidase [Pyrinomonadaceae bacterium]|nr:M28 family metallopeptidase [Pyrinomonadaceae bacterium]